MLSTVLILLIILWFLGYIRLDAIAIPDLELFVINNQPITLWNLLIFFVILWAIGILPSPVREIAAILFLLWILSVLGILAFAGLSNLLVLAIIGGLILSLAGGI